MFQHLLVPVDGTDLSERAARTALELAAKLGAAVTAFVVEPLPPLPHMGTNPTLYQRESDEHNLATEEHANSLLKRVGDMARELGVTCRGHFYGCASNSDTLFRLTKTGVYTALHHLAGGAEGASVTACSLLASDGHLYGMTYQQGAYGYGTIFRATLDGQITTVHAFTGADQGQHPSQYVARMAQGSDGALYGETTSAAANAPGYNTGATTYRLDLGLSRPAPRLLRASALRAAVGDTVLLTGSNLLGATGVSINGTAAPFEVRSAQYLVMTVPVGAHSGSVEVVTPAGQATSPFVLRIR